MRFRNYAETVHLYNSFVEILITITAVIVITITINVKRKAEHNFIVKHVLCVDMACSYFYSVVNSGWSSVIADHLGLLVGQNRCRFLKMTEHN